MTIKHAHRPDVRGHQLLLQQTNNLSNHLKISADGEARKFFSAPVIDGQVGSTSLAHAFLLAG